MKTLALHILDIVQNAITAKAENIFIDIEEDTRENRYVIRVTDDGCGMSEDTIQRVTDPYYTSRTTRKVGMGIPLLKQHAEMAGGHLRITSEEGKGTKVAAVFEHDHVDRQSTGDIAGVMVLLIGSNPEIRFRYGHQYNGKEYTLDTREIKEVLDGVPLNDPEVLKYLREMIRENLHDIGAL